MNEDNNLLEHRRQSKGTSRREVHSNSDFYQKLERAHINKPTLTCLETRKKNKPKVNG